MKIKDDWMDVAIADERQTSLWSDESAELEPEEANGVPDLDLLREQLMVEATMLS